MMLDADRIIIVGIKLRGISLFCGYAIYKQKFFWYGKFEQSVLVAQPSTPLAHKWLQNNWVAFNAETDFLSFLFRLSLRLFFIFVVNTRASLAHCDAWQPYQVVWLRFDIQTHVHSVTVGVRSPRMYGCLFADLQKYTLHRSPFKTALHISIVINKTYRMMKTHVRNCTRHNEWIW